MSNNILTELQIAFLKLAGANKFLSANFYLTGGTPLAAFYLEHRYSEDLDFFSEKEFDLLNLNIFLKEARKDLKIQKIDFQQSFNRNLFFLHFDGEVLKTEFTYFPFHRIERGTNKFGVEIDSLLDIATNKLFTIYQRTQARDYIDLYFICKEFGFLIPDLVAKAKIKFDWHIDPIQLGTQFIKVSEAKDYPRMIKNIDHNDLESFFIGEAKNLKSAVLS